MKMTALAFAVVLIAAGASTTAACADIKVLTAGAFKQVLLAMLPEFEQQSAHKVIVDNDTVGALTKRIESGEGFDLAVLTPGALDSLSRKGKLVPASGRNLARVGIGVVVKGGG